MTQRKHPGGCTYAVVTGRRHESGDVLLTVRCSGRHAERMFRDRPDMVCVHWGTRINDWSRVPNAGGES